MKVFVYFNLHRKVWSIKALEGEHKNRVIGHANGAYLTDVTPKISEAGRQRVLREKAKNVHAGLVGNLIAVSDDSTLSKDYPLNTMDDFNSGGDIVEITYNPYKYSTFVSKEEPNRKMLHADLAAMVLGRVFCHRLEVVPTNADSDGAKITGVPEALINRHRV